MMLCPHSDQAKIGEVIESVNENTNVDDTTKLLVKINSDKLFTVLSYL